jgi:galactokinase
MIAGEQVQSSKAEEVRAELERQFGSKASVVARAPGRVNLIGEHTDYNDGFVMPAALEFDTWVAGAERADRRVHLQSMNFKERVEFDLDNIHPGSTAHWSDYVRGVAGVLEQQGTKLRGTNLLIRGDVPLGAGLSSSASLEVATALALCAIAEVELDRRKLALLSQRAEHDYVGTKCGIMDQFVSLFGKAGHALMLDCRSLEYKLLPLRDEARLVICNTNVKHELATGEYNQRRADCEVGVAHLKQFYPEIRALRDVSMEQLENHKADLGERVYRRCRHVITENERVLAAADALVAGRMDAFGRMMYGSHASLRNDYEVSCKELDVLVKLASEQVGVYGARMTGGGFGGCTVNLVKADVVDGFVPAVKAGYKSQTGLDADVYVGSAADGAEVGELG